MKLPSKYEYFMPDLPVFLSPFSSSCFIPPMFLFEYNYIFIGLRVTTIDKNQTSLPMDSTQRYLE
jgi:hypothetical protein